MTIFALRLFAVVVKFLTELEGDAAPPFKGVVTGRALLHACVSVQEVTTRHTRPGTARLRAPAQTLIMAALSRRGAGMVFTRSRTNCGQRKHTLIFLHYYFCCWLPSLLQLIPIFSFDSTEFNAVSCVFSWDEL